MKTAVADLNINNSTQNAPLCLLADDLTEWPTTLRKGQEKKGLTDLKIPKSFKTHSSIFGGISAMINGR
jgi:hypothetical protein